MPVKLALKSEPIALPRPGRDMDVAGDELARGAAEAVGHGDHQAFLHRHHIGEVGMVLQRVHDRQFGGAGIAEQMGDALVLQQCKECGAAGDLDFSCLLLPAVVDRRDRRTAWTNLWRTARQWSGVHGCPAADARRSSAASCDAPGASARTSPRAQRASSFSSAARPRRESPSAAPAARRCRPIPAIPRSRCDRAAAGRCGPRTARAGC